MTGAHVLARHALIVPAHDVTTRDVDHTRVDDVLVAFPERNAGHGREALGDDAECCHVDGVNGVAQVGRIADICHRGRYTHHATRWTKTKNPSVLLRRHRGNNHFHSIPHLIPEIFVGAYHVPEGWLCRRERGAGVEERDDKGPAKRGAVGVGDVANAASVTSRSCEPR